MTTPADPSLPPYPYPTEGPLLPGQPVPQYPPYIAEQDMNTSSGSPRSTLDNLHGDQGVVLQPPGEKLGPPVYPHSQDLMQPYGPDDPELSRVWIPDHRPLAPGSTVPASSRTDEGDKKSAGEGGDGTLNVRPADLHKSADDYTELAARVAAISPQAADELTRIIATHGVMGYPAAVGIAAGLAAQETALDAKSADFTRYAARLTEHAITYASTDAEGAARYL